MKEACKLKITLLIFLFSGMAVNAQCPSYDTYKSKILQTFYDANAILTNNRKSLFLP